MRAENNTGYRLASVVVGILLWLGSISTVGHAADNAVLEAQARRVAIIEKAAPTVVAIFGADGGGGGSGVIISPDGYALTNFHVVEGAGIFMKCGLNDGNLYDAVIVGIDPTGDVALIKLLGREDFRVATMGDSDQVKVGDWVYAMGNPFLLASDFRPTVTYGIVSGTHRYQYPAGTFLEYTDCLQVDASINPGNSGGPLFNNAGELIGINGRISVDKRGRVNSGAGFAISINQIRHFLGHLRGGRIVDHATLGATVTTESDGSVIVERILEQSEAYRRGLREDDEVVSFAGRSIRSVNQFKNILGIYPNGWKIPLVYRREGQKHEIYVRLRRLHRKSELGIGRESAEKSPPDRESPPDDKPPEEPRKDDKKPNGPKQPGRPQQPFFHPQAPAEDPVPEEYKSLYVQKEGFANYYFNKLEQERIRDHLAGLGEFAPTQGKWNLSGKTSAGLPFEFVLTERFASLETAGKTFLQQADQGFQDEPEGTGGLLAALTQFRLLLARGESSFTDFYYVGREPLDGRGGMVDVLATSLGGMECRWYFPSDGGPPAGFDAWLGEDADPCEVRFLEFRDFESRRIPTQIVVSHGGDEYATFRVERVVLER